MGGSREWYIPTARFSKTLLLTIGATGGFRYDEDNVMTITPMKKHVGLLVRNLNRAAR